MKLYSLFAYATLAFRVTNAQGTFTTQTRTLNFDSLPTGAAPATYKGFNIVGFNITTAKYFDIQPASPKKLAQAINPFRGYLQIPGQQTVSTLSNISLGCSSSQDNGQMYAPADCSVTIVSHYPQDYDAVFRVTSYTVNYSQNPKVQFFDVEDAQLFGGEYYFFLSSGLPTTQLFLDNVVFKVVNF